MKAVPPSSTDGQRRSTKRPRLPLVERTAAGTREGQIEPNRTRSDVGRKRMPTGSAGVRNPVRIVSRKEDPIRRTGGVGGQYPASLAFLCGEDVHRLLGIHR